MRSQNKNTPPLVDVTDRNGIPTGQISNADEVNNLGYWHSGVRVIIYTPEREVLVQKRSHNMEMKPGMIEIGVGGMVDSGETPLESAVREVEEETSLVVSPEQLEFIGITRYNRHWKYRGQPKNNKSVIHTYLCQLSYEQMVVVQSPQLNEVEWVKVLPLRTVKLLVKRGKLNYLGKVVPWRALHRKWLSAIPAKSRAT